jgi:uncharacterized membrane protein
MFKKSRWRSPVAWGSVATLILFVLKNYGLLAPIGLTEESFNELTILIFAVVTAFGIFNNPTDKEHY